MPVLLMLCSKLEVSETADPSSRGVIPTVRVSV